jgi:hypothetical protein
MRERGQVSVSGIRQRLVCGRYDYDDVLSSLRRAHRALRKRYSVSSLFVTSVAYRAFLKRLMERFVEEFRGNWKGDSDFSYTAIQVLNAGTDEFGPVQATSAFPAMLRPL